MSRSRRAAPVDPQVLARLSAVLGAGGWVPPPGEPAPAPSVDPAEDRPPTDAAMRTGPGLRPVAQRRRGRHAAARQPAAHELDLPVTHLPALDLDGQGPDGDRTAPDDGDWAPADSFDPGSEWESRSEPDREGEERRERFDPDREWPHRRDPHGEAGNGPEWGATGVTRSGAARDSDHLLPTLRHDGSDDGSSRVEPRRSHARPGAVPPAQGEPGGRRSQRGLPEADGGPVPRPADTERVPAPEPLLDRWRSARLDPGRRGVAALVLVALLAVALAAFVVLRARPHAVAAPDVVAPGVPVPSGVAARAGAAARSPSPGLAPATPPAERGVAVAGKVVRPGLVRLPAGSRVDDAVRAAGGPLPATDLGTVNLARVLVDGEQVLVGVPQTVAAAPLPGASAGAAAGPVDLNAATVAQLDALPGIGPVLAQKIVDWRGEHGRFGSVDQLREVSGIGESKYSELAPKVRV